MSRQDQTDDVHDTELTALSESRFELDVLDEDSTHLVVFWASWSKDCTALLQELKHLFGQPELDDVKALSIGSVDIEANAMLSIQYNIRTLPTLLVFHGGLIHESHEGYLSTHELSALITRVTQLRDDPA